ncbi:chondroitin sulfate proteoglycan 5-like isoform 2-T2 [Salvelinus alpinus]
MHSRTSATTEECVPSLQGQEHSADFQVLCVVVGVASLTLIPIIIIVFFATQLHRFRTENRRLRKRSLYRPQSEMQTDGFSVSIAPDSSHANLPN